ncbi:MAG: hypothetical protein JWP85_120 [Rhodoglobus sp.]|nr:hypothetical protein [Rhodoglobus sp.]
MVNDVPLVLTFDPQTVDHLGSKMYSHLPNAVAELVANAYDADANKVDVVIGASATISIADDGHGMSRQDVADKYLHIGRNRRIASSSSLTESGRRSVSGKKGLGKLALFGIGKKIELITTRAGSTTSTVVQLSYDDMMAAEGQYNPTERSVQSPVGQHGTVVRLTALKRTSAIDPQALAKSLSRLFNYGGKDFRVRVLGPDGTAYLVTPEMRLSTVDAEFEWAFPESWSAEDEDEYGREHAISGRIVSAASPLGQGLRGITLYVSGRLANEPEYFGSSESSFVYSYLTGYLNVDYLDGLEPDVIATDRRAIDWNTDETAALQLQLRKLLLRLGQEWRVKRNAARRKQSEEVLGGDTDEWVASIKAAEQEPVRALVATIESDDIDITSSQQGALLKLVKEVAPPHAEFVWRHLHPEIQAATSSYYIAQDYYKAVEEAIKRYVNSVAKRSSITEAEASNVVSKAFGDKGKLRVFQKYMAGNDFNDKTAWNIEHGQQHVSMGIVAGFRNPLAHEEIAKLHDSGAFTHDDCLDALSMISHLMRRLDDAEDTPVVEEAAAL